MNGYEATLFEREQDDLYRLLEQGKDVNGLSCHYEDCAFRELMLNEAYRYGCRSLVGYLLKHGADPNKPNGEGRSFNDMLEKGK